MKFNEKELAELSSGAADLEGRLNHKRAHKSGSKERWFKLKYNLLFYFNINEIGQIDTRQPAGVIVLENYNINLDMFEGAFAFSISFRDEHDKRHILSGRSEDQVEQWVAALKQASYEYWRSQLIVLQETLCRKTGKDPLLMQLRNQGIIRDEAWEPASKFSARCNATETEGCCSGMRNSEIGAIIMKNSSCASCPLGPPPDILHIPPPPFPEFLQQSSDFYPNLGALPFPPNLNDSPCKHLCDRHSEGVQYIEMPKQGTVFDDTWLLVLISSCVGVILIGIILATLLLKCKLSRNGKNGVISMPNATTGMQTKNGRIQNEAVLYPCAADTMQDSRVMWATLTPRGTTRHYLEEHTYETIGGGQFHKRACSTTPTEHTYADPPVTTPVHVRPKDDKAFDNTAFVDYEEPLSVKTEYYQLNDVLEPSDAGILTIQRGTLRPHVSSPTRIEHPNLPPLNLLPHKRSSKKGTIGQHASDTLLRSSITSSTYIPTI
ncbi:hypothetical protein HZH66_006460 [Vespula vulgaris]|uniref:Pleckstrin homology domain-containing family J member 1 n=1 Tax=Vespula vulgaris TaxID=7454 RepID=A0A834K1T6_VESVU|nr:hypothetical protein HZH66_006460 [Vespula vulgaris]